MSETIESLLELEDIDMEFDDIKIGQRVTLSGEFEEPITGTIIGYNEDYSCEFVFKSDEYREWLHNGNSYEDGRYCFIDDNLSDMLELLEDTEDIKLERLIKLTIHTDEYELSEEEALGLYGELLNVLDI